MKSPRFSARSDKKQETRERREKCVKCCIFTIPFYILIFFIILSAAVYYYVEQECQTQFLCGAVDWTFVDNTGKNVTAYLTKEQKKELADQHPGVIPRLDYWKSIHFIVITITTIGYGDISPCTANGQLIALLSAIIGIPIMVFSLNRFGKLFGLLLHKFWKFVYCRIYKPPYKDRRVKQLENEEYLPLLLGICITLLFIFLCGIYFYLTLKEAYSYGKEFTFVNSLYFTMVSFLTIGYGEFAPIKYDLIFPNLVMLMIGLSLVALCIRLFRTNMEDLIDGLVDKIDKDFQEDVDAEDTVAAAKKARPKTGQEAARKLIEEKRKRSAGVTKILTMSVTEGQEEKLAKIYDEKMRFVNVGMQTEPEEKYDFQVQVTDSRQKSSLSLSTVSIGHQFDGDNDNDNDKEQLLEKSQKDMPKFVPKKASRPDSS